MASSERIDKFYEDSINLLKSHNITKIINEIKKLSVWMQKHQSETVPDNHKQVLLTVIESYYNYNNTHSNNNDNELLFDAVYINLLMII